MGIMIVDFIIPMSFTNAVTKMATGAQNALLFYNLFGSLRFAIASFSTSSFCFNQPHRCLSD